MARRVYSDLRAYLKAHPDETQNDLARELGISISYLSMMKWGSRQPPLALALRMAQRFNIPLESLVRAERRTA